MARDVLERAIENSLVFGLYSPSAGQAGFARVTVLRFVLGTADAHGLYERFGFEPADPDRMMDRKIRAH